MAWEVEYTDQFGDWFEELTLGQQRSIIASVEHLERHGPGLGRPPVDTTIRGSRHANTKELRPAAGGIRVLFAFDPRRMAILLIGGDKSGRWREWYLESRRPLRRTPPDPQGGGTHPMTAKLKTRRFADLAAPIKADPTNNAAIAEEVRALEDGLALAQLRAERGATQQDVARALDVSQANVSRIEHQENPYLSTLRAYVEALGGELEINAVFPDRTIALVPNRK